MVGVARQAKASKQRKQVVHHLRLPAPGLVGGHQPQHQHAADHRPGSGDGGLALPHPDACDGQQQGGQGRRQLQELQQNGKAVGQILSRKEHSNCRIEAAQRLHPMLWGPDDRFRRQGQRRGSQDEHPQHDFQRVRPHQQAPVIHRHGIQQPPQEKPGDPQSKDVISIFVLFHGKLLWALQIRNLQSN